MNYTRRRFLTDLLFVGGALTVAAGMAATAEPQKPNPQTGSGETIPSQSPSPPSTDCPKPEVGTQPSPRPTTSYPTPGRMVPHRPRR